MQRYISCIFLRLASLDAPKGSVLPSFTSNKKRHSAAVARYQRYRVLREHYKHLRTYLFIAIRAAVQSVTHCEHWWPISISTSSPRQWFPRAPPCWSKHRPARRLLLSSSRRISSSSSWSHAKTCPVKVAVCHRRLITLRGARRRKFGRFRTPFPVSLTESHKRMLFLHYFDQKLRSLHFAREVGRKIEKIPIRNFVTLSEARSLIETLIASG